MGKYALTIRLLFYVSAGIFIASWSLKDRLPPPAQIRQELYRQPRQTKVDIAPFETTIAGVTYVVEPLYAYELYGLIVSLHRTDVWWDIYHRDWKDKLNIKDICVIWGENLKTDAYRRMKFRNGSWTCYVSVNAKGGEQDWKQFNMECLSNNHLLSDDNDISRRIMRAERGDQIYLKGYLARYSHDQGQFRRGTSISRTDTAGGACETIFVQDFMIVARANVFWRTIFIHSGFMTLACAAALLIIALSPRQ